MAKRSAPADNNPLDRLPDLPLGPAHWRAIADALSLSKRQAEIAELTLRDAGDEQIARALGISLSTLKTQRKRIAERTGAKTRMQLAMRVLVVSHQLCGGKTCQSIG